MNIIEELGLKPVINAAGTLTLLGGSILDEDVTNAMMEALKVYIDMNELHIKAGRYIAKLIGVEDAYTTRSRSRHRSFSSSMYSQGQARQAWDLSTRRRLKTRSYHPEKNTGTSTTI